MFEILSPQSELVMGYSGKLTNEKNCTKPLPSNDQNVGHSRYNGSFVKYDLFCILFVL